MAPTRQEALGESLRLTAAILGVSRNPATAIVKNLLCVKDMAGSGKLSLKWGDCSEAVHAADAVAHRADVSVAACPNKRLGICLGVVF